jgi:hypothetical protein
MAAHAAQENISPIDLILAVMREPHVALGKRVKMALKALPHVHAKATAGQPTEASKTKRSQDSSGPAHVNTSSTRQKSRSEIPRLLLNFLYSRGRVR